MSQHTLHRTSARHRRLRGALVGATLAAALMVAPHSVTPAAASSTDLAPLDQPLTIRWIR